VYVHEYLLNHQLSIYRNIDTYNAIKCSINIFLEYCFKILDQDSVYEAPCKVITGQQGHVT